MAQEYLPCFRPITATALSVKATEKIIGSPLTTFVPHAAEAFLNSHDVQHFSSSCLTSLEVLLLPGLHITQSYPTLCDPIDYSLPGSSVHGILQARILEWAVVSSSRLRDQTPISCISCISRQILCRLATWEAHTVYSEVK